MMVGAGTHDFKRNGTPEKLPGNCPSSVQALYGKLTQEKPENRITASDAAYFFAAIARELYPNEGGVPIPDDTDRVVYKHNGFIRAAEPDASVTGAANKMYLKHNEQG